MVKLVLLPVQLGNRTLDFEFITHLELVDVLTHLTLGVILDDKVNITLCALIGCGGVWANDISWAAIFLGDGVACDNARSNVKTTDGILRQFKTEDTGVMVNGLDFLEFERLELLRVEGMLRFLCNHSSSSASWLLDSRLRRTVIVNTTGDTKTSEGSEE
jgi:hypothetical protein